MASENSSMQTLPVDLFHVLSLELAARLDFATLYNCVVSSKHLANAGAVSALYRVCHENGFADMVTGENITFAEADVAAMRWSILWKSIINSASGKTMFPYARHLRLLDLKDLKNLLETLDVRTKIGKKFFVSDFARFHHKFDKSVKWRAGRLNIAPIIIDIGDEVIRSAPLLEALTEPTALEILATALPRWIPQLGHLRELTLWDSKALADESLRNLLHASSRRLEKISIYNSTDPVSDIHLGAFIGGMQENTLVTFETISRCNIGRETCLALNHHGESLKTLKLAVSRDGLLALGLLQGCTAVETLAVSSLDPPIDLKATENDSYLNMLEWLRNCTSLKDVSFDCIPSAPDLLLPVLLNQDTELQRLQINSKESSMFVANDHQEFLKSLSAQPSLRALDLMADPEPPSRDGNEFMLEAFCSLKELRELNLNRIVDTFSESHIHILVQHLPQLEDVYLGGGYGIGDGVWDSMAGLKGLKRLTFAGTTSFTVDGFLGFIEKLGKSNRGLYLTVDNADPETMLSQDAQNLVRDTIVAKVDGAFEYQPIRDPDIPEFDQSDSD